VQPFLGVPPKLQVPVGDVGGQSAGEEQAVDVAWAHTLTLMQFPPGLEHDMELLYLHLPTVAQGVLALQVTPVAEQMLDCAGQSEVCEQLAFVNEQKVSTDVWVSVEVCVLVEVWVPVAV
jgi:hypothetical protein